MRTHIFLFALLSFVTTELNAQKVYAPIMTPEEEQQQLSVTSIQETYYFAMQLNLSKGVTVKERPNYKPAPLYWWPLHKRFALSPDGKCYAIIDGTVDFINLYDSNPDIPYEITTVKQNHRFFKVNKKSLPFEYPHSIIGDAMSFTWGTDGKLYIEGEYGVFSTTVEEYPKTQKFQDLKGTPIFSQADNSLYCEWYGNVYKYDIKDNVQTELFEGANLTISGEYIYFMRTINDHSEIWRRNVITNQEEKVLRSPNHAFTNPSISPDGKWIICEGNTVSPLSKKQNIDLFIAKTDGSNLKQITNHPANDVYPVWQTDGKHIYFMSLRGTKYNKKDSRFMLFSMDVSSFIQ